MHPVKAIAIGVAAGVVMLFAVLGVALVATNADAKISRQRMQQCLDSGSNYAECRGLIR